MGDFMKKVVLLLLAFGLAISPAVAADKNKPKNITNEEAEKIDPNEARGRILRDGLPLILPSWAQPIYFNYFYKNPNERGKKK